MIDEAPQIHGSDVSCHGSPAQAIQMMINDAPLIRVLSCLLIASLMMMDDARLIR